MSKRKPTPPMEMAITTVEQLKVIGDPLRIQLIEIMAEDPGRGWTAKALAERLETKQTKLYHHLGLLEEHGFIRVGETRMVSGILEKRYQATAHGYHVDRALLTGAGAESAVSVAIDAIFERARSEILVGLRSGTLNFDPDDPKRTRMGLWATHARLSPANVKRVMRLVEKLAAIDADQDPDGAEYGLLVGFYPRATKDTSS
ncbi:MAG TPA: helix-turn-helix domain-containing protein [Candidatus Limnocylindria bacterium]